MDIPSTDLLAEIRQWEAEGLRYGGVFSVSHARALLERAAAEIRAQEQKIVDLTLELSRLQVRSVVERERKGEDTADVMTFHMKGGVR